MTRFQEWLDGVLRDPGSAEDEALGVKRNALLSTATSGLIALVLCINATGLSSGEASMPVVWLAGGASVMCWSAGALTLLTHRLSKAVVMVWLLSLGIALLLGDWFSFGIVDAWTLVVLVMDGLLAFGGDPRAAQGMLVLTVVYLVVRSAQEGSDFGFYDGLPRGLERYEEFQCPNKGMSLGLSALALRAGTFITDYMITRSFATTMVAQYEAIKLSQRVSETLAVLLSRYEVDEAEAVIESEQCATLPPALRGAFRDLVNNLKTYKPLLPQSCLPGTAPADDANTPSAPSWSDSSGCSEGRRAGGSVTSSVDRSHSHDAASATTSLRHSFGTQGKAHMGRRASNQSRGGAPGLGPVRVAPAHGGPAPAQGGAVLAVPARVRVSIVCVNRKGFLAWITSQRDPALVQGLLRVEVGRFAQCVSSHKGVVDSLNGDHFRSSFNAARSCPTHCASAVASAYSFATQRDDGGVADTLHSDAGTTHGGWLTGAVCSGPCVCGDFGSSAVVRYMIIGSPYNLLSAAERLASTWMLPLLVDGTTHGDVAQMRECRLRCALNCPKLRRHEHLLWDTGPERLQRGPSSIGEWMYELEDLTPDPWDVHTEALQLWLRGDPEKAARRAANALPDSGSGAVGIARVDILDALQQLVADISAGAHPPRYNFSEVGLAPASEPLQHQQGRSISPRAQPGRSPRTPATGSTFGPSLQQPSEVVLMNAS